MKQLTVFLIFMFLANGSLADLKHITIRADEIPDATRINPSEKSLKAPKLLKGYDLKLWRLKFAQKSANYKGCVQRAENLYGLQSTQRQALRPWLMNIRIDCSLKIKTDSTKRAALKKIITTLRSKPEWFLVGPYKVSLKSGYVESLLAKMELDMSVSRNQAWESFDLVSAYEESMSSGQKARMYRLVAELAFIQQKFNLAKNFILQSLQYEDSKRLRDKLAAIDESLLKTTEVAKADKDKAQRREELEATLEEERLYKRMTSAIKAGAYVPAMEDGVKLISEYPSGVRASRASKSMMKIYRNVGRKKKNKYRLVQRRLFNIMKKAPYDRNFDWGHSLYRKARYNLAIDFFLAAEENSRKTKEYGKVVLHIALSALYIGKYDKAKDYFKKTIEHAAGTPLSEEALFRLGLLHYRLKDYALATGQFERLKAVNPKNEFALSTIYWLYRAHQKLDNKKQAQAYADELVGRAPWTYYGYRILSEREDGLKKISETKSLDPKFTFDLTKVEAVTWDHLIKFLKIGWTDEAQLIVRSFPEPQTERMKLLHAILYAKAQNHLKSFRLVQEVRNENESLLGADLMRLVYPTDFNGYVEKYAEANKVPKALIQSIIRQESAYKVRARSRSNARGLMQLLPTTGREIAQQVRPSKRFKTDELYDPYFNIRLGSNYIRRLIRAFNGHSPSAIASYNLGIGRLRTWMGGREDLSKVSEASLEENEIWFDELPWRETSIYVKAVLRGQYYYDYLATL